MVAEREFKPGSGWGMLVGTIGLALGIVALFIVSVVNVQDKFNRSPNGLAVAGIIVAGLCVPVFILMCKGFIVIAPNTGAVMTLFGEYRGTVKMPGLWWANPFMNKQRVSLRVRNFNTEKLKVNDLSGNPIEIAAVVVWRVADTAKAVFDVDDYTSFVNIQSEAAVRHLASSYAYDGHEGVKTLRGSMEEVSKALSTELQARLDKAGLVVDEARLSHLAYAAEIAGAMLRRQQAEAVVSARMKIVEGAVGMVELALDHLSKSSKVHLDDERKAAMVSNLMVVLCGDQSAHPVVNTGSLYT